ncbi:hypothetical protein L5G28_07605 [Gordonia sp. HY285]|uniref:hypothetical protein n=1 Tax=Gordonia liuliyuniae TaxID=2911517 RepID=UPI001F34D7C5|nr:hypothetical protein [Gordonia liuliyuniae]MCF8610026.1 hypothetical protein [Gordonia liuliyuniae]
MSDDHRLVTRLIEEICPNTFGTAEPRRWWIAVDCTPLFGPAPHWRISSVVATRPPYVFGGPTFRTFEQARAYVAAAVDARCKQLAARGCDNNSVGLFQQTPPWGDGR